MSNRTGAMVLGGLPFSEQARMECTPGVFCVFELRMWLKQHERGFDSHPAVGQLANPHNVLALSHNRH